METTTETDVRRGNIRLLVEQAGGTSRIAKKLKISDAELRSLANKRSRLRIRSWLAREIEAKLGLAKGWLDTPHKHFSNDARVIAQKWQLLPSSLQLQVKNYINLQLESLNIDIEDDDGLDDMGEKTDFGQVYDRFDR